MAGGVGLIMDNAKKALAANQLGIATTSHNVANVNTQGYSRQRIELESSMPQSHGKDQIGGGVDVKGIVRSASEFLNRRIENENTSLGRLEGMADIYGQVENVFKDEGEGGLSSAVSKFFNDIRSLSGQPESSPLKSAVRESAVAMTAKFRGVTNNLNEIVKDLDRRIDGSVTEVNSLTSRVATLNARIMDISARGGQPNDELDSRDLAVKELSKHMPLQVTPLENNGINLQSGRLGVLVNTTESFKLQASRSGVGAFAGNIRVYVSPEENSGAQPRDVTDFLSDGTLGGYIKARDQMLPKVFDKVDQLAHALVTNVNDVHKTGFSRTGQSGIDFFKNTGGVKGSAEALSLSEQVLGNVNNIVTARNPVAAGDNRVLLAIADLEDKKILENNTSSFVDFNSSIVGNLGVETRAANDLFANQRDMMSQLDALKEQTVGVSLDEEAVNMIKFQRAFDASAKMIQVADSMLDTVLNLKRF